jgi:hypothetical protein
MKKEQETTAPKRRDFLRLAGLGGVTAAASAAAVVPAEAKEEPNSRAAGYRETGHVKKVYELARF